MFPVGIEASNLNVMKSYYKVIVIVSIVWGHRDSEIVYVSDSLNSVQYSSKLMIFFILKQYSHWAT